MSMQAFDCLEKEFNPVIQECEDKNFISSFLSCKSCWETHLFQKNTRYYFEDQQIDEYDNNKRSKQNSYSKSMEWENNWWHTYEKYKDWMAQTLRMRAGKFEYPSAYLSAFKEKSEMEKAKQKEKGSEGEREINDPLCFITPNHLMTTAEV